MSGSFVLVCVFDYRGGMSMLLKCVTGAVAGLAIGLFFKGVEFILKRACGYVVSEGYKQLYFFWGIMFMVVYGLPALYAYIGVS